MGLLDGGRRSSSASPTTIRSPGGSRGRSTPRAPIVGFSSVESLIEKRVRPLAESIGSTFVEPCDVQSDDDIRRVFARWEEESGGLDILVHALAFANREDLARPFVERLATDSRSPSTCRAYSLVALAREARPLMGPGVIDLHADLLRRREGRRELQRHGRGQGGARGVRPLPRGGSRPDRDPGQRDQRRPDPDAGGGRHRGLQVDLRLVRRDRAAARQHHDRGCRQDGGLPGQRPLLRGHRARSSTSTAASTSSGCRCPRPEA